MTLVAYYRVSTQRQGESGLGLEAQRAAVGDHARRTARALVAEFTEVESGRRCDRPQLRGAIESARAAGAGLVVAKLDRLARDARFLLALADGGVPLYFLDLPELDCATAAGRMILTIMASVAEFESRRIGERVRAAWAARKARGAIAKWPSRDHQRRAAAAMHARDRAAVEEFRARHRPTVLALRETMTLSQVADELNRIGITTRRGKKWTAGLVHHLLK